MKTSYLFIPILLGFFICQTTNSLAQAFGGILNLKSPGAHVVMNAEDGNPIPANEDFTIEFWFRTCGDFSGTGYIIDHREGTTGDGLELSYNTNTESFTLLTQGNGNVTTLTQEYLLTNMLDGAWRHYVLEYTASIQRFRLYMNGTLAAQQNNMSLGLNLGSLFIGCSDTDFNAQFTGELDDLHVSLGLLYNSSTTYIVPTNEFSVLPTSTALWHFNQPEGFLNFPDEVASYFLHGTSESGIIDPIITEDFTTCFGHQFVFDGHEGFNTYSWQSIFGSIFPFNAENPSSILGANAAYWLTASDGPCFYTDTVTVTVTEPNGSVGPNQEICLGDSVQLTASGGGEYAWAGPFEIIGNQNDTCIVFPPQTVDFFVSIMPQPGCLDLDTITVFVNPNPIIEAVLLNDTVCTNFNEVAFLNSFNDIGVSFTWVPETGLDCTNCLSPSITITETTTYTVTSYSAAGCSSDYTFTIYGAECTSVDENTSPLPEVYPNPAQDFVTIKGVALNTPIELYTSTGILISSEPYRGQVDIHNLSRGAYFIRLSHGSNDLFITLVKHE
jgi:hypothetical protein